MSQASVLEFIEVAKKDSDLRSRLQSVNTPSELKAIAESKGYHATEDELITTFNEHGFITDSNNQELSDDDLDRIDAGCIHITIIIK